jgi:hypothetical protein
MPSFIIHTQNSGGLLEKKASFGFADVDCSNSVSEDVNGLTGRIGNTTATNQGFGVKG